MSFIVNKNTISPVLADACGQLKELYNSENISISYSIMKEPSKTHKHMILEEVYYVVKGKGLLRIEDKKYSIKEGDTISIPKGKFHQVIPDKVIEVIVVTHPKFDSRDVIDE